MNDHLPPTPADAARSSLAAGAKDAAKGALLRRVLAFARRKLPRPVYHLIFGGRSVGEIAEVEARRRVRNILWGCGFSTAFGCLVGIVILLVVGIIAGAVAFG